MTNTLDIYIRAHGSRKQRNELFDLQDKRFTTSKTFRILFYWKHSDVVFQRARDCEILKAILRAFNTEKRVQLIKNYPELIERFGKTHEVACEDLNNLELNPNFSALSW